jgi:putative DNA primase/helicase
MKAFSNTRSLGDLRSAARALGGQLHGQHILCPGPGHSRKDRSLSVTFADHGFVCHSFAGDDWKVCRDHVRAILGLSDAPVPVQNVEAPQSPQANALFAAAIWKASRSIEGTPAAAYLEGRGLQPVEVLRFHQACPFKRELVPAMVAPMVDARTNEFRGVHRTRLNPKDKAMLGPVRGAVVKLSPDEDVTTGLHICEGIETGLALIRMGFRPLWACMSAGGIAAFPLLRGIEALTIFVDNDASGTGERAARECAQLWLADGCEVKAYMAPEPGTDFADLVETAA